MLPGVHYFRDLIIAPRSLKTIPPGVIVDEPTRYSRGRKKTKAIQLEVESALPTCHTQKSSLDPKKVLTMSEIPLAQARRLLLQWAGRLAAI